jgi:hypothetical protein
LNLSSNFLVSKFAFTCNLYRYDEAGLPYALAATGVMLVGAGIGFWVVRKWMIEPTSGRVAEPVAGFSCVAMRIVGVVGPLYKLNPVVTHSLTPPGFNPWSLRVSAVC